MDKTLKTIETYDLCVESFEQKFMDLSLYKEAGLEIQLQLQA